MSWSWFRPIMSEGTLAGSGLSAGIAAVLAVVPLLSRMAAALFAVAATTGASFSTRGVSFLCRFLRDTDG